MSNLAFPQRAQSNNNLMLVILFVISAKICQASADFYDIPAYQGHFSRRYFQQTFITAGSFARVEFHFSFDAAYDNQTFYFARPQDHCVYSYSKANQTIEPFVGQCGTSGNAIGSKDTAKFNKISSVAYFKRPSAALLAALSTERVLIVSDQTCKLSNPDCLLTSNYPSLTISNLRYQSPLSLYADEANQQQLIYLADTGNHCIKVLSVWDKRVRVVGGKCGEAGFLDGPMQYNRLDSPKNLGVSRKGVIYFFDSGNEYIRIIDLAGNVKTLQLGACKEFGAGRLLQGYQMRQVLCYENWIEGITEKSTKHYFDPSILTICSYQSSQCAWQK